MDGYTWLLKLFRLDSLIKCHQPGFRNGSEKLTCMPGRLIELLAGKFIASSSGRAREFDSHLISSLI